MKWTLKSIADMIQHPLPESDNQPVVQFSVDSRTIREGMVFVALKGDKYDGHLFVEEVFEKKAAAAIVDEGWYRQSGYKKEGVLLPVKNPLKTLQHIAGQYRKQMDMPVIAVTGTNGKTTTKEMIAAVLETQLPVGKTTGNLNNHIGLPLTLCSWTGEEKVGVVEMGINHFGELTELCEIAQPTHGVITNIGKGHLEFLKDLEGVAKAKCELLHYLTPDGQAFINGDDTYLHSCRFIVDNTVTFGFGESCDIRGYIDRSNSDLGPRLQIDGLNIHLTVEGAFQAGNALAAVAVGYAFGIKPEHIQKALHAYKPVSRRMEKMKVSSVTIFDDTYNANPSSMVQALETFQSFVYANKKYIVLGDMLELGEAGPQEHQEIGQKIRQMDIQGFLCFGPLMEFASAEVCKGRIPVCEHFESKEEIVEMLLSMIQKGDAVFIKGSRNMKMDDIVLELKKALENVTWR